MSRSLRALIPVAATTLAVLGGLNVVQAPAANAGAPSSASIVVALASRPTPPSRGLLYGTHEPATTQATQPQALLGLESRLGRTTGIDRSYTYWDDAQPSGTVTQDLTLGRVPLLSIEPRTRAGVKVSWSSIASGAVDDAIRRQATALGALPGGVILALHHEAEIAVGYGTAADYVAAYRHYVAVFRSVGATNVSFAWVLTPHTFKTPALADAWYPGDDVVDWIGADAYNLGSCKPGVTGWRSMQEIAGPFYAWGSAHGKPLVLAEYGSAADPNDPGRRAQWLRDTNATFQSWPNLRAVAYFDSIGTCDWRLAPDETATNAFRDLSRTSYANGAPSAWLRAATPVGPAPLTQTFDLSQSTGADYATGRGVGTWTLDFGDGSVPATGTGNPTSVTHVYPVGTFTATLTVRGGTGGASRTAKTTITAAGAPTISQGEAKSVTASSAALPGWVSTFGLSGTYQIQYGKTTAFGTTEDRGTLSAITMSQAKTETLSGLAPGTRYYWRYVATTAAGTTYGPTRWFATTS